jgi:tetratricopeptide (TPR) repeat protein
MMKRNSQTRIIIVVIAIFFDLASLSVSGQVRQQPLDKVARGAELFEAGQNAHERGDLEKAVGLYGDALKMDGTLWQAEYQRALALMTMRRMVEAKDGMERAIRLLTDYEGTVEGRQMLSRAWLSLAEIEAGLGENDGAERSYRRVLEFSPGSGRAQRGLAELYLRMGRGDDAVGAARAAIAIEGAGTKPSELSGLLGAALMLAGREAEALQVLDDALSVDGRNVYAFRRRAEIRLARREFAGAVEDLRQAMSIAPDGGTRLRLAWALAQNRESVEALKLYSEILKADPTNNEAKIAVAALSLETGEGTTAIKQLEVLIVAEPGRADLRARLAELLIRTEPERALEQYLAAAKLEPGRVSHRIGVGGALVRLRRMAEAVAVLRSALAMNPADDVAYYAHTNLGTALYEMNDFGGAVPEFSWILEHQQDEKRVPITLYFLGICFDRLGHYDQALKVYQQFLEKATNVNQLEIDKVRLRLPILQKQIKDGKGKRKK